MRDVAAQAEVSVSTVSRVLSGVKTSIPISQDTRQRVLEVARGLRYQPNPSARALRGKSTHLLGLIVREIEDLFFAELIGVISDVARGKGYDLVLGHARSDPEEVLALSEILDLRRCDGLFLLGDLKESAEDHAYLSQVAMSHLVISLCRGTQKLAAGNPYVDIDNRKGAFMALDYLVRLGHRRIAFLDGGRLGDLQERIEAYCEFVRERLGKVCPDYIQSDENSYAGSYRAMQRLLSLRSPPTAVFTTDDTMAVGAMKAAADMGFVVPTDVSVIGFDDIKIAPYLQPALTTIRQPIEKLGATAVELLLEMVKEKSAPEPLPRFLIEPELMVRDSCAPPPR